MPSLVRVQCSCLAGVPRALSCACQVPDHPSIPSSDVYEPRVGVDFPASTMVEMEAGQVAPGHLASPFKTLAGPRRTSPDLPGPYSMPSGPFWSSLAFSPDLAWSSLAFSPDLA